MERSNSSRDTPPPSKRRVRQSLFKEVSHEGIKSVNERENREIEEEDKQKRTYNYPPPPPPFTYSTETDSLSTPLKRGNKITLTLPSSKSLSQGIFHL